MLNATLITTLICLGSGVPDQQEVLVVVGSPGTDEYGAMFEEWAGRWHQAASRAKAGHRVIGTDETGQTDRDLLQAALLELPADSVEPLWIILIGHGTFDGKAAKFNLRGRDVTAAELAEWLRPLDRPVVIANSASSSAPFINRLSAPNRVIVSATKNGFQYNFARFGNFLSRAIIDPAADLDKDEQVSILEAFLMASSRTQEFYADEGRLATEHALIDDNGDGKGTPADWYHGVRAIRAAKEGAAADGLLAKQLCLVRSEREASMSAEVRKKRDDLERGIASLRTEKKTIPEPEYYARLEPLLVKLAKLYESLAADGAEE